MIDLRLYRVTLLPALAAIAVLMFSLGSLPEAKRSRLALPNGFDGGRAASTATELARLAPDRRPGSPGNARIADFVRQRFTAIQGGEVTEQEFSGAFHGDDVKMRNVILTLPGQSDRRVALIAHRDEAAGAGLASSAASTGTLLEIAASFSGSTHQKTLVFASTDGGTAAALGARRFGADYPGHDQLEAVISLEQPGAAKPRRPFVVPWSAGSESTAIQLTRSAEAAVRDEIGGSTGKLGVFGQLVQLALPGGLGEQSVLIDEGLDAVSVSSAGERPLPEDETGPASFSADTVGEFGRATLSLILAFDATSEPLEHGPAAYVNVAGNLLPGWSLRLLALALIAPVLIVAIDAAARVRRRDLALLQPLAWVLSRAAPFIAALLTLYLFTLVTALPSPGFPFDSRDYAFGWPAGISIAAALAALAGAAFLARPVPPSKAGVEGATAALALVSAATALLLWLLNPYLALLAVPAIHLWLVPSFQRVRPRVAAALAAVALGLVLPVAALVQLSDRLELGRGIAWNLTLMVSGGHIGPGLMLLLCVLAGCAVATVAAGAARRRQATSASEGAGPVDGYANHSPEPANR
jgi:hypothetical protein